MLPLAIGMKVALTQHLDRSTDKLLLKGTIGRVHSWQWNENDRLPSVVYVKFEKAGWQLDGIDEPASKTRLDYFLTIRLSSFSRQISDYYLFLRIT